MPNPKKPAAKRGRAVLAWMLVYPSAPASWDVDGHYLIFRSRANALRHISDWGYTLDDGRPSIVRVELRELPRRSKAKP